jgi:DNA-binding CsgD family transcriptional regulator
MEMIKESLEYYNNNNGEFSGVYRMKNRNNEYRWIYSNTCVLKRNPDGSPWMIIGVGFDITERIKTEPQLKLLLRENLLLKNSHLVKQLTKREKELIKLIAKGYTNKKIAEELQISYLTAQTHRKNILKKLDAKNTAGITSFALQNHLD